MVSPKIIELLIDDDFSDAGLDGIALVEHPAHEALFQYFSEQEEDKKYVLSEEEIPQALQMFASFGEPQGLLESEGWKIVEVSRMNKQLFADIIAEPNKQSPIFDTPDTRVRFKYVGPKDEKNRPFCADMMTLRRVFRIEDIDEMSRNNVNSVGPDGYDIFEWRGSYNCRHGWVKLTYRKEGVIINNDKFTRGLISEQNVPGPDTRTQATIDAGNTPPRDRFSKTNMDINVSGLSPYVDQVDEDLELKPVLTSMPLFENEEDALEVAKVIGCEGAHPHQYGDKTLWMPCSSHPLEVEVEEMAYLEDACWPGYEAIGMKEGEDGRMVPNCVPIKEEQSMMEFESYDDYPKEASENACRVLKWIDEYGRDEVSGMELTGLQRANQLCNREPISEETIARMAAFERHRKNSVIAPEFKGTPWKDKGYTAWLGWGGDSGVEWAQRKLESLKNQMAFSVMNTEERLVVGPAMIPDKLIIRRNETPGTKLKMGEIYYVYFSAETIKVIQQKYMRDKLLDKANIEHTNKFLKGVDVVESWIVDDPEKDKQQVFGMNYPKGTWMIIMKVEDDDVWEKVKKGELKGYSVQGYFLEKAKFSKQNDVLINEVKNILKEVI